MDEVKVDFHVHLEEGPYSLSFAQKSIEAFEQLNPMNVQKHSKEWLELAMQFMNRRLTEGEYSEWWLDLYLQQAVEQGLKVVGIVDHLYRFYETKEYFDRYMDLTSEKIGKKQKSWLDQVMVRSLEEFVHFIVSQKEKWAKKGVQLRLGIEADYFDSGEEELKALLEPYPFDYVIGSVHFYDGWGFDNPQLEYKFSDYDLLTLYKKHFKTVENAIDSGLFDFIAHLDNIKVYNYRPDESMLLELYRSVGKKLKEKNVATEINPGLYYRYPVKEMCPSQTFFQILIEEGVRFTTSSDAHFPHHLGIYSDEIRNWLVENGITKISTFQNRSWTEHPIMEFSS